MITSWHYSSHCESHSKIKEIIRTNNYKAIDVGASVYHWSYPEAKYVIDIMPHSHTSLDDIHYFTLNLDKENEHKSILDYVNQYGKFDYSICSHTIEDLMLPFQTINLLPKISNRGVIILPSKVTEFRVHGGKPWRGFAHHKQFFDVIDNKLMLFPKLNFIEYDDRSNLLIDSKYDRMTDIVIFWENEIPYNYFSETEIFYSDSHLIDSYYNLLLKNIPLWQNA